ncbi:MAG: pyrroline-5-carboxylate reductase [Chloroflexota bacterium]|nr:pyrroline-5-carboxylate reductase [Chloroflexota bacterium]
MALQDTTIGFIGSGNMGEAMIKGLLNKGMVSAAQIVASDPNVEQCERLTSEYGVRCTDDNADAAARADILVLSIKPQVFTEVAPVLRRTARKTSMVLSIMAGVRIRTIADGLANPSVVRSMPNTPAQIGEGITVWTTTGEVTPTGRDQARAILSALGDELYVSDEKFLDMATALSGTGPAYIFMFMEAMIDAGVHMGFSRRDAERLVLKTMRGSVDYAMFSKLHPAELRNQVTSPGGTSAAAIYEMEKGGLRTVLADAIWAAYERSKALGDAQEKADK